MPHGQRFVREINERIEQLNEEWALDGSVAILCECGRTGCDQRVELEQALYQAVLAVPNRYVVRDGHQGDGDTIVERNDGYLVAEPA